MSIEKRTIVNSSLLGEDAIDGDKYYLEYSDMPYDVGIFNRYVHNIKTYWIYSNDEHGNIDFCTNYSDYETALMMARELYDNMMAYYNGMKNDDNNGKKKRH